MFANIAKKFNLCKNYFELKPIFVNFLKNCFKVENLGASTEFGVNERIEISKISGSGGALAVNVREGNAHYTVAIN